MICLLQDPIPGRDGSALREGGRERGRENLAGISNHEDVSNLLHGQSCKDPSCPRKAGSSAGPSGATAPAGGVPALSPTAGLAAGSGHAWDGFSVRNLCLQKSEL